MQDANASPKERPMKAPILLALAGGGIAMPPTGIIGTRCLLTPQSLRQLDWVDGLIYE
jgi:hypothetical protein